MAGEAEADPAQHLARPAGALGESAGARKIEARRDDRGRFLSRADQPDGRRTRLYAAAALRHSHRGGDKTPGDGRRQSLGVARTDSGVANRPSAVDCDDDDRDADRVRDSTALEGRAVEGQHDGVGPVRNYTAPRRTAPT